MTVPGGSVRGLDTDAIDAAIAGMLHRHPVVGMVVGVVGVEGLLHLHTHGVESLATGVPISDATVFRIASITKTFTGIGVMQLVEDGLVDLDVPIDAYLRTYRVTPKSGQPVPTIRHMLTHTAGLGELAHATGLVRPDFGESVSAGAPLPTLAEFYEGGLRCHAAPGSRFVYNNHGPATLGQLIEDVTSHELGDHLRARVLEPLGMHDSSMHRTPDVEHRLATGYEIRSRGARAVAERDMVTAGAASMYATPADMGRYLTGLLGGGSNDHGRILQPGTLAAMFAPAYQPDPRLAGMGLAFFRSDLAGHPVARHQGTHPGFHSEIAVAPDAELGVMAFTNGAAQPDLWLPAEVASLLRMLLGLPADAVRTDVAHHPEVWEDLCGWYRLDARGTDVRLRGMLGAGAEVLLRDGFPVLRFLTPVPALYRGLTLHPDDPTDPYVFRIDLIDQGLGTMRLAFAQDDSGRTDRLVLEVMPLVLTKQPPQTNPRRVALTALGALAASNVIARVARRP